MSDIWRKPQPGEPLQIPSAIYSQMLDTIKFVDELRRDDSLDLLRLARDRGLVKVKNESGSDRSRFDVLGTDNIITSITPTSNLNAWKNWPVLKGETPTAVHHWGGKWVQLLQPLKSNAIGWGLASGITVAQVDFYRNHLTHCDVWHGCGSTPASAYRLQAEECGAGLILWDNLGGSPTFPASSVWCIIKVGVMQLPVEWHFELAEDLDQYTDDIVSAYRKWYDPSINSGKGGLVVDCNWEFDVGDLNGVGHTCETGGNGTAHVRMGSSSLCGIIHDLQCPGEATESCEGYPP